MTEQVEIVVPDMHCAGCANGMRERLLREPGVGSASFDFKAKTITAHASKDSLTDDQIKDLVAERKYRVHSITRSTEDERKASREELASPKEVR